jgi:transcriptional regulator with XRE-family HTH domain
MEWMDMDGANVKQLREARAWSQEQLAAHSGLSLRTIQRIEAQGRASKETLQALAAVFEVDVGALKANAVPKVGYLSGLQYRLLRLSLIVAVLVGVDIYRHGGVTWSRWVVAGIVLLAGLRWLKARVVRKGGAE